MTRLGLELFYSNRGSKYGVSRSIDTKFTGCGAWNRTKIHGFRDRLPTFSRPRNFLYFLNSINLIKSSTSFFLEICISHKLLCGWNPSTLTSLYTLSSIDVLWFVKKTLYVDVGLCTQCEPSASYKPRRYLTTNRRSFKIHVGILIWSSFRGLYGIPRRDCMCFWYILSRTQLSVLCLVIAGFCLNTISTKS